MRSPIQESDELEIPANINYALKSMDDVNATEPRFIGKHDAQATATPGGSPPSFPHSIGKIVFLKAF
jgi:hypothetical protein